MSATMLRHRRSSRLEEEDVIRVYLELDGLSSICKQKSNFCEKAAEELLPALDVRAKERLDKYDFSCIENDHRHLQVGGMDLRFDPRNGELYLEVVGQLDMSEEFVRIGNDHTLCKFVTIREKFDGDQISAHYSETVSQRLVAAVERSNDMVKLSINCSTVAGAVKVGKAIRVKGSDPTEACKMMGKYEFELIDQ